MKLGSKFIFVTAHCIIFFLATIASIIIRLYVPTAQRIKKKECKWRMPAFNRCCDPCKALKTMIRTFTDGKIQGKSVKVGVEIMEV